MVKKIELNNTNMESLMQKANDFMNLSSQINASMNSMTDEFFQNFPDKLKDLSFKTNKEYNKYYIKNFLIPTFAYKDITQTVITGEDKDPNIRLLVPKVIKDNVLKLVVIPTHSHIPESKVSHLTTQSMHIIIDLFHDNKGLAAKKYRDAINFFTSHDFENDKEVKLNKQQTTIKKAKLHNRLQSLKQDGWNIIDAYTHTSRGWEENKSLVFTLFRKTTINTKDKIGVGTLKTLLFNNNGEWTGELDTLQLTKDNWTNLARYWTEAVKKNMAAKEELKKEIEKNKIKN